MKILWSLALCLLTGTLLTLGATSAKATPIEWTIGSGGNGHWYELFPVVTGFAPAQAAATTLNGYLVTVTSSAENAFVFALLNAPGVPASLWLGGFHSAASPGYSEPGGGWAWQTGEAFGYINWQPGEPADTPNTGGTDISGDEDHLAMSNAPSFNGRWFDLNGNAQYNATLFYMVEWNSDPSAVPEPATLLLLTVGLAGICMRRLIRATF